MLGLNSVAFSTKRVLVLLLSFIICWIPIPVCLLFCCDVAKAASDSLD